jgi:hypothetical protein
MASPSRSTSPTDTASRKETAERAARITAMLDRWGAEDVSGEPEWSVEDIEPMKLRPGTGHDNQP